MDWKDIGVRAIAAFFASTSGAVVAFCIARHWLSKDKRRDETLAFISEYFSADFVVHRDAVSATQRAQNNGETTFENIALGFWPSGRNDYYHGTLIGTMNEHNHLTFYFGFLARMSAAHDLGLLDSDRLRESLQDSMEWEMGLAMSIASELENQTKAANRSSPMWVRAIRNVNSLLKR